MVRPTIHEAPIFSFRFFLLPAVELHRCTLNDVNSRSRRNDGCQREICRSVERTEVTQLTVGKQVSWRDDFLDQEEFALWSHYAAAVREDNHRAIVIPTMDDSR